MDEGNVVVEATNSGTYTPQEQAPLPESNIIINTTNNNGSGNVGGSVPSITQPIEETGASDIMPMEQRVPLTIAKQPLVGSKLDDLQIIEMLSQMDRSNIYGQYELQKAGIDTELNRSLYYFESKNKEAALEEYKTKLNGQMVKANATGYFIKPEHQDLINQSNMAKAVLNNPNATNTEKSKARDVLGWVEGYFKDSGISMKGVETLDKIMKDGEIRIAKAQIRAAGAEASEKIRAMDDAILMSIIGGATEGKTDEELIAEFSNSVSANDIKTIASSTRLGKGIKAPIEAKARTGMTQSEVNKYKVGTYKVKIDGKEKTLYKVQYNDTAKSHAYVYETTDGDGNKIYINDGTAKYNYSTIDSQIKKTTTKSSTQKKDNPKAWTPIKSKSAFLEQDTLSGDNRYSGSWQPKQYIDK